MGVQCVDCVNLARTSQRPVRSSLGFRVNQGAPVVTIGLVLANVAVYVLGPALWGQNWRGTLAMVPGLADEEPWRWVSSAFAHADPVHIGINMLVLFQVGSIVELMVGRARYLVLYLGSALGASALIYVVGPKFEGHVGASGAIFGLFAAYIIIGTRLQLDMRSTLALPFLWLVAGFFIAGISWQGHLGGAIAGVIITLVLLRGASRGRAGPRPGG